VNKQVRVTGRLDATQARPRTAADSAAGGSTSARDDVRANSTTVADSAVNNGNTRRVTVETVQAIAESCTAR
jgi:RecA/RadA recombinase